MITLLDYYTWARHGGLKRKMFGVSGGGHEELFASWDYRVRLFFFGDKYDSIYRQKNEL